jgi:hypothetical protein
MNIKNLFLLSILFIAIITTGCGSGNDQADTENEAENVESTNGNTSLIEVSGQLFSIPSPIQTAILIKEVGSNYNNQILNSSSKVTAYASNLEKSLNLGIYGADLGYVTIYDQTQDAISYLGAVKKLANELGITNTFDQQLAERFEKNIGNQDAILSMVSDAFKAADAYLKNNDRNDVGILVLTGGWIESVYFSTKVAEQTANDEVIRRIGEQKTTCNNIIKLLMPYYGNEEYVPLIDKLSELNEVFKGVESSYTYQEPTVDVAQKTTTINSTSDVHVNDEQLKQISSIIEAIRNDIIN